MTDEPQHVPSEAEQLWSRLREQLRWTMAKETYENLLQDSEGAELEGHTLTVEVRTSRALPWLNERLMANLLRTAHMLADPELEIVFTAEDEEGEHEDVEIPENGDGDPRLPEEPGPRGGGGPQGGTQQLGGVPSGAVHEQHDSSAEPPLVWTDYYIKLKLAFRKSALSTLKGAPLSVFLCLALHMNKRGTACVGIEALMKETGYSRRPVCAALDELESLRLISKQVTRQGVQEYRLRGYAWMGRKPAPVPFETGRAEGPKQGGSGK